MMKFNAFDYVQRAYGENVKKGGRVKHVVKGSTGTIAKAEGQYIYILWDGDLKPKGPYHPRSDLEYLS